MSLTDEELDYAEKLLNRMEKKARTWKYMRWLVLLASVGGMGGGVYGTTVTLEWQRKPLSGLDFPDGAAGNTSPVTRSELRSELALIQLQCNLFCQFFWTSQVLSVGGVVIMIATTASWNKGKRDALVAKIARTCILEKRPDPR